MPIPTTREELLQEAQDTFAKLSKEIEDGGPRLGKVVCAMQDAHEWTVKDVLVLRGWWTNAVLAWVEQGRLGEFPITPAEGFSWQQTPLLNQQTVNKSKRKSYKQVIAELNKAYQRIRPVQAGLKDHELLEAGVYEWCGKLPVIRWIALNTTRQYATARSMLRKARKSLQG